MPTHVRYSDNDFKNHNYRLVDQQYEIHSGYHSYQIVTPYLW